MSMSMLMFQSGPGPKTGANLFYSPKMARQYAFQSGPGPKTGANRPVCPYRRPESGFNPAPARRPGRTRGLAGATGRDGFQSGPGPKTGANVPGDAATHRPGAVSIRPRPEDRGERRM